MNYLLTYYVVLYLPSDVMGKRRKWLLLQSNHKKYKKQKKSSVYSSSCFKQLTLNTKHSVLHLLSVDILNNFIRNQIKHLLIKYTFVYGCIRNKDMRYKWRLCRHPTHVQCTPVWCLSSYSNTIKNTKPYIFRQNSKTINSLAHVSSISKIIHRLIKNKTIIFWRWLIG